MEDWLVHQGLNKLVNVFKGMFFSILDISSFNTFKHINKNGNNFNFFCLSHTNR